MYYGERSGFARGHATFLTPRTLPDVVARCQTEEGVDETPLDVSLTTESIRNEGRDATKATRLRSRHLGGPRLAPSLLAGGKGLAAAVDPAVVRLLATLGCVLAWAMAAFAWSLLVWGTPTARAASWPVYGKDLSNSRNAVADGPSREEARSLAQRWSFSDPDGDFTGTPVVAAGLLVAGSFDGEVHALDAVSGVERWVTDVGGPINGSAAINPQAPGGGAVYVPVAIDHAPRLVALSLSDGALRWSTLLTDQEGSSVYGSPTYWDGTVYIGTSGPNGDDSTARGSVLAIDANTGLVRWRTFTVPPGQDGGPVWSTPAVDTATGRLYVGTGNAYHDPAAETTDAILALDAANGAILGHFQATPDDTFHPDDPTGPDVDFGASPNLIRTAAGTRLVGEGAKSGVYWAVRRGSMKPVWNSLTGPGSVIGGIVGSTGYDGTRIYGTNSLNGGVWALRSDDGTGTWSSSDAGPLDLSPVALGNGILYTADPSGSLIARDAATGATLSKVSLGSTTFGGISVVGGAVYVAVGTGPLPPPGPQQTRSGSIVAFGDTSRSAAAQTSKGVTQGGSETKRRIRLRVRPERVSAGVRRTFRFRTRMGDRPVAGARIRFARTAARTGRRGKATIRVRLDPGTYRARATKRGLRPDRDAVRARKS